MQDFLALTVFNNSIQKWLTAIGAGLLVIVVLKLAIWLVKNFARNAAEKSKNRIDDLIVNLLSRTYSLILLVVSIQAGSLILNLPANTRQAIKVVTITALLVQAGFWLNTVLNSWISNKIDQELEKGGDKTAGLNIIRIFSKIILWSLILILILDNIPGVKVNTLIASLGIGGIAVGLALQNILGDLFASLTISLDKPFQIGDFILIDDLSGEVEHVGLKSTRIRSFTGEQLIFANNDLLSSRIRNNARIEHRRVLDTLGVCYETPLDKLNQIPAIIQEIIEEQSNTTFLRAHFKQLGDFALIFEFSYFIESSDYVVYMDIRQAINYQLMQRFAVEGIEFAYPTQTVILDHKEA
jgi:small-conductance mechanosensitive channel